MVRVSRIVTVAAFLACGAGFLHGWRETQKRRVAEGLLAEALQARMELSAGIEQPITLQAKSIPDTSAVSTPEGAAVLQRSHQDLARQRASEAKAGAAAQQQFIASRETQEEIAGQFRMNLRLRYGAFYVEYGLSGADISGFEDAMMEKYWTMSDVLIAARDIGLSDHETAELRRQQLARSEEKIRLAWGERLYREYMRFDATADARGLVEELAGEIFCIEPLSAAQGSELAAAITANTKSVTRPDEWLRTQTFAGGKVGPSWSDVDWDAVVSMLGSSLSQPQLFTLHALAANANLKEDIARRLKEADQRGRETARSMPP